MGVGLGWAGIHEQLQTAYHSLYIARRPRRAAERASERSGTAERVSEGGCALFDSGHKGDKQSILSESHQATSRCDRSVRVERHTEHGWPSTEGELSEAEHEGADPSPRLAVER